MPSLTADRLGHAFRDDTPLFEDASFHLGAGWTGVVGANGAGKSTLLALLAGAPPTSGRVRREPPDARVVLCPQLLDAPVAPSASSSAAHRLLGRLRLDPAVLARWPTLSPGEQKRWQIAAALAEEPDVLLLDEPTNHLDAEARDWLVETLGAFDGVGVVVSHDRALLDALCGATLRIADGACRLYPAGYSAARALWEAEGEARRRAHVARAEEERRLRARLADARRANAAADARRSAGARMKDRHDHDAGGIGAQFRVDRAAGRRSRDVEVARSEHARARDALTQSRFEPERGRAVLLDWEPPRVQWLFEAAGRAVGRADRVRVAGPNGAGKTTLLAALLAGARIPEARVLHLPQELAPGQGRAWLAELRALDRAARGKVLQVVAALGVDPPRLLATSDPSPGEARKLGIALGLGRAVWAAVLDEPTNHLDLPSIERLQDALAAWPGALVLVSHDDAFARALTTTTWCPDRTAPPAPGSSSDRPRASCGASLPAPRGGPSARGAPS